jgi:phosphoribosyl-AMP cyclohydrolase
LKPGPDGLIAAIAQDVATGAVLMLAHMDREALRRTLETGQVVYWSRSRQTYWRKGETSGHTQQLVSAALDCDGDAVLLKVIQTGPACHTGTATCFTSHEIPLPDRRASVTPAGGDDDA